MKVWSIRDKRDGFYMPAHMPSKQRGAYSSDEPRKDGGEQGPRLFPSLQSARNSLTAWLAGKWKEDWNMNVDFEGISDEKYDLSPVKEPHRLRENMEIVEFNLVEVS